MRHNDAVRFLGSCPCPCHVLRGHALAPAACWCDPTRRPRIPEDVDPAVLARLQEMVRSAGGRWDPPQVSHNDAVAHLRSCPCPCHSRGGPCRCSQRTEPALAAAFARQDRADLDRRLRSGRATPAEYLRHAPHLLPGRRR